MPEGEGSGKQFAPEKPKEKKEAQELFEPTDVQQQVVSLETTEGEGTEEKYPRVDSETGIYTDSEGQRWATLFALAQHFGVSRGSIQSRLKDVEEIKVRSRGGEIVVAYALDTLKEHLFDLLTVPQVDRATGTYTDEDGQEWAPESVLAKILNIGRGISVFRDAHTAKKKVRTRSGRVVDAFSIKFVRDVVNGTLAFPEVDHETGIYKDENGQEWASVRKLMSLSGLSFKNVSGQVKGVAAIKIRDQGRLISAYPLVQMRDRLSVITFTPEVDRQTAVHTDRDGRQWASLRSLASLFDVSDTVIAPHLENLPSKMIRGLHGRPVKGYPVEAMRERLFELLEIPRVNSQTGFYTDGNGREWAPLFSLAQHFGVSRRSIQSRLKDVEEIKVRSRVGEVVVAYPFDVLKERLSDLLTVPEVDRSRNLYRDKDGRDWGSTRMLSQIFGISKETMKNRLVDVPRMQLRDFGGHIIHAYSLDVLRERIGGTSELAEKKIFELSSAAQKEDLVRFMEDIESKSISERGVFDCLLAACGSSKCIDILFKFRPEYKKIPIDYVKNVLAEYLGDYLAVKRPFELKDMTPEVAVFFSDLTLKEGLKETLKQDCLSFYYKEIRSGANKTDREVLDAYLDRAVSALGDLGNRDIDDVVQDVVSYFENLFSKIEIPENMVGRLGSDRREFPDVNQRINYQELKDKKRLLIADEMGLGKSGSVIFAKEALQVGRAVLVVPANVISTWERYLSDKREKGGYFKADFAPRVHTVQGVGNLEEEAFANAEYIILSQERLADEKYVGALKSLDIGMLVVDEMHLLKNLKGVRSQGLVELSKKIEGDDKYLALLSGTPVPNTVRDIALTLKLLYPEKFSEMGDGELVSSILGGDLLDLRALLLPRMQMKTLRESVEMPELQENIAEIELQGLEKDIYEIILEEDELTPIAKMQILRKFLLNPELVDPTPGIESSKIAELHAHLQESFRLHNKVVVFINGFVEDVIRGNRSIIDKLDLPKGLEVSAIHGEIPPHERVLLQEELRDPNRKMLLLVSGQTAAVGVDFSSADEVLFYNEPWTQYDKDQQLSRVYRPGLRHDLESTTFITSGTIEEGIHKHIEAKFKSIEKLLNGIPLTELEQELLKTSEEEMMPTEEINPELAKFYFSSWERMMSMFTYVKELGEKDFQEFLQKFAREYAECYMELGSRSYQANANRVTGTVISRLVKESGKSPHDVTILDTASGPEMLRKHIADYLGDHVVSMDINAAHFREDGGKRVVGSFLHVPLRAESVDYAAMTLSWHYTNFVPSQQKLERIESLRELYAVLKPDGKAILNLIYSLKSKKPDAMPLALQTLGFRIVDSYSGDVIEGGQYASQLLTLEKIPGNEKDVPALVEELKTNASLDALKFVKVKGNLRDSRGIITEVTLGGRRVPVELNERDKIIHTEERQLMNEGRRLRDAYGDIEKIPRSEVIYSGFSRVYNGKKYVLFAKLKSGPGAVVIK